MRSFSFSPQAVQNAISAPQFDTPHPIPDTPTERKTKGIPGGNGVSQDRTVLRGDNPCWMSDSGCYRQLNPDQMIYQSLAKTPRPLPGLGRGLLVML
jgi:hypothetical protein